MESIKKIVACLDMKDGRTVKGIKFKHVRDAGDPLKMAQQYVQQGADEIVFLDITATNEKRKTRLDLAKQVAEVVSVPFTVGGGISSVKEAVALIEAGVDKVSVNTAAFENPALIDELVKEVGSSRIVSAIDATFRKDQWLVCTHGGEKIEKTPALDWGKEVEQRGVGEVLLTSKDHDGMKHGFALDITKLFADQLSIPVIASGGAGTMEDFLEVFQKTEVAAALGAGVFHFKDIEITKLKEYLKANGIPVSL